MSTTARLYVEPVPELGAAVRRFTIDCKRSTTQLIFMDGGDLELFESTLVSLALQALAMCERGNREKMEKSPNTRPGELEMSECQ